MTKSNIHIISNVRGLFRSKQNLHEKNLHDERAFELAFEKVDAMRMLAS